MMGLIGWYDFWVPARGRQNQDLPDLRIFRIGACSVRAET